MASWRQCLISQTCSWRIRENWKAEKQTEGMGPEIAYFFPVLRRVLIRERKSDSSFLDCCSRMSLEPAWTMRVVAVGYCDSASGTFDWTSATRAPGRHHVWAFRRVTWRTIEDPMRTVDGRRGSEWAGCSRVICLGVARVRRLLGRTLCGRGLGTWWEGGTGSVSASMTESSTEKRLLVTRGGEHFCSTPLPPLTTSVQLRRAGVEHGGFGGDFGWCLLWLGKKDSVVRLALVLLVWCFNVVLWDFMTTSHCSRRMSLLSVSIVMLALASLSLALARSLQAQVELAIIRSADAAEKVIFAR